MSNQKFDVESLRIATVNNNGIYLKYRYIEDNRVYIKHPISNHTCNTETRDKTFCRENHGLIEPEILASLSIDQALANYAYNIQLPNKALFTTDFVLSALLFINTANYYFFQSTEHFPTVDEVMDAAPEEQKCELLSHLSGLIKEL